MKKRKTMEKEASLILYLVQVSRQRGGSLRLLLQNVLAVSGFKTHMSDIKKGTQEEK